MEKEGECWLTQQVLHIPGAQFLVKGFGSSDCKCISHLVYTPLLTPKVQEREEDNGISTY